MRTKEDLENLLEQIGRVAVSDLDDDEKLMYIQHATDYAPIHRVFVSPDKKIDTVYKLARLGLLDIKEGSHPKTVTVLRAKVPRPMFNPPCSTPHPLYHLDSEETVHGS